MVVLVVADLPRLQMPAAEFQMRLDLESSPLPVVAPAMSVVLTVRLVEALLQVQPARKVEPFPPCSELEPSRLVALLPLPVPEALALASAR